MPFDAAREIFGKAEYRRASAGEVLVRQNEPGEHFYVMLAGRASVHKLVRRRDWLAGLDQGGAGVVIGWLGQGRAGLGVWD